VKDCVHLSLATATTIYALAMRCVAVALGLAACSPTTHISDAPSSVWTTGPALPVPRFEPGVTALGVQLVVAGGYTSQGSGVTLTTQVDILDVTDTESGWKPLPPAPIAWNSIQLAALGTTIYLLGGLDGSGNAQGAAWSIDTTASTPAWTPLTSMPAGSERGGAVVLLAQPRVYLLGGLSSVGALASVIYYDTTVGTWGSDIPPLPAPRAYAAGMHLSDGALVVAGGFSGTTPASAVGTTYQLPLEASSWVVGASTPSTPRGNCAYGIVEGALVCAGGEDGTGPVTTSQSYDALTDQWTDQPSSYLPMPVAGTPGTAIGQQLFVAGGANGSQLDPTSTLYVYSPFD
jgi:N-acetylneuraminic acid mutarotase